MPSPTLSYEEQQLIDRDRQRKRQRDEAAHEMHEHEYQAKRAREAGDKNAEQYHRERVLEAFQIILHN